MRLSKNKSLKDTRSDGVNETGGTEGEDWAGEKSRVAGGRRLRRKVISYFVSVFLEENW